MIRCCARRTSRPADADPAGGGLHLRLEDARRETRLRNRAPAFRRRAPLRLPQPSGHGDRHDACSRCSAAGSIAALRTPGDNSRGRSRSRDSTADSIAACMPARQAGGPSTCSRRSTAGSIAATAGRCTGRSSRWCSLPSDGGLHCGWNWDTAAPTVRAETSAHVRSRSAWSSRHAARETRASTRRSRRAVSIGSLTVTRPAAFRKLAAVAVLTARLLPGTPGRSRQMCSGHRTIGRTGRTRRYRRRSSCPLAVLRCVRRPILQRTPPRTDQAPGDAPSRTRGAVKDERSWGEVSRG